MASPALETLRSNRAIDVTVSDLASRYTLGSVLGEGRFSQVWSATKVSSGAAVALKQIELSSLEDDEAVDALVKEVTALRRAYEAEHAHVVRLHEVVETADQLYLVLDRVAGCEVSAARSNPRP